MPTDETTNGFYVSTELREDGRYQLFVELMDGTKSDLSHEVATAFIREVMTAITAAEHDASVYQQLWKKLGLSPEEAGYIVSELRADRAEHTVVTSIPGLTLVPGVSARNGKGFVQLQENGKDVGQWEMAHAKHYSLMVMEALVGSEFDQAYLRLLTTRMNLDVMTAANVVHDLVNYR